MRVRPEPSAGEPLADRARCPFHHLAAAATVQGMGDFTSRRWAVVGLLAVALGGCTTSGGDHTASGASGSASSTTGAGGTTAPGPILTVAQGRSLAHDPALVGTEQLTENPVNPVRVRMEQYGECQDYYRQVDAHTQARWVGQLSRTGATDQSGSTTIGLLDDPGMADRLESAFEPCRQRMVALGILAPSEPPEKGQSGQLRWTRVTVTGARPAANLTILYGNLVVTRSRVGSTDLPLEPFLGTVAAAVDRAALQ